MEVIGDPEGLAVHALEAARREAAELLAAAEAEAAQLLEKARAGAEAEARSRAAAAGAAAALRAETLLAAAGGEEALLLAALLEAELEEVRTEAERLLREEKAAHEGGTLAALAAQAVAGMDGAAFVLRTHPGDAAALRAALPEVGRLAGREGLQLALEDDASVGGGVVVRAAGGGQLWDNSLTGRLERLWPSLRAELAGFLGDKA